MYKCFPLKCAAIRNTLPPTQHSRETSFLSVLSNTLPVKGRPLFPPSLSWAVGGVVEVFGVFSFTFPGQRVGSFKVGSIGTDFLNPSYIPYSSQQSPYEAQLPEQLILLISSAFLGIQKFYGCKRLDGVHVEASQFM